MKIQLAKNNIVGIAENTVTLPFTSKAINIFWWNYFSWWIKVGCYGLWCLMPPSTIFQLSWRSVLLVDWQTLSHVCQWLIFLNMSWINVSFIYLLCIIIIKIRRKKLCKKKNIIQNIIYKKSYVHSIRRN